jgi:hypothetical protein
VIIVIKFFLKIISLNFPWHWVHTSLSSLCFFMCLLRAYVSLKSFLHVSQNLPVFLCLKRIWEFKPPSTVQTLHINVMCVIRSLQMNFILLSIWDDTQQMKQAIVVPTSLYIFEFSMTLNVHFPFVTMFFHVSIKSVCVFEVLFACIAKFTCLTQKRTHTHPKRYACDCGKTYSCAYGLNRHTESCQDKVSQNKSDKETCSWVLHLHILYIIALPFRHYVFSCVY